MSGIIISGADADQFTAHNSGWEALLFCECNTAEFGFNLAARRVEEAVVIRLKQVQERQTRRALVCWVGPTVSADPSIVPLVRAQMPSALAEALHG